MNIHITDKVGFDPIQTVALVKLFLNNRKPADGTFDYGLETHGLMSKLVGLELPFPIHVKQLNKRKSDKSPIHIIIEKHITLI